MKKNFLFIGWILSILLTAIFVYENPEKIDNIKSYFKAEEPENNKPINLKLIQANNLKIEFREVFKFENGFKTAFINYKDANENTFDLKNLEIFFQNGNKFNNKTNNQNILIQNLTDDYNGGVKNIFIYKDIPFAFLTMLEEECYYAGIVNLKSKNEIFRTSCLGEGEINFNGVGSASLHLKESILLSIGAPGWNGIEIAKLAQDQNSFFGKIIEIEKKELDLIIKNEIQKINPKIFSSGHRNPQGLILLDKKIFSTEHGPKGGDELNEILKGKNYGWPISSYGVKYTSDKSKITYFKNHKEKNFEEPLFALIPSVGLSSLNTCPKKISDYYNKPCLMASSLWGNELRQGKSILFYLLDEEMRKVISVEKIFIGDEYPIRHFVTSSNNILFEDNNENIYLSVDGKGIYSLNFTVVE